VEAKIMSKRLVSEREAAVERPWTERTVVCV
jgi:hypothetical protein